MRVLVTGANGHVGNNLCRALIERGHQVRASVRSLKDPARTAHLLALPGIELVELQLGDQEQFDHIAHGIDVLCHTAQTYAFFTGSRARDDALVSEGVAGVEHALRSAAKNRLKKVVLTSSIVTLPLRRRGEMPATELDWNEELRVPYYRAKTLGERRAWELARVLGVELVTLLPGAIGGGGFVRRTPTTDFFEAMTFGSMKFGAPAWPYPYVDVADVVSAHVLAAEGPATGRFILCPDNILEVFELSQICHRIDPTIPAAPRRLPDLVLPLLPALDALAASLTGSTRTITSELVATLKGHVYSLSNDRAREVLGWRPRVHVEQSLRELLDRLRALRASEAPVAAPVLT